VVAAPAGSSDTGLTMIAFVGLALLLIGVLAMTRGRTRAARARNLRWIVAPLLLVALGLFWGVVWLGRGLQENCEPHCVTDSNVRIAGVVFVVAAVAWLLELAFHFGRRRVKARADRAGYVPRR
jgi:ABC-type uncharacterized transport system YnjBCD permease subunit